MPRKPALPDQTEVKYVRLAISPELHARLWKVAGMPLAEFARRALETAIEAAEKNSAKPKKSS